MREFSKNRRNLGEGDGLAASNLTNNVRQIGQIFSHSAIFVFFISIFFIPQNSYSIELKQRQFGAGLQSGDTSGGYVSEVPGTEGMSEQEVVTTLRHDIQLLDEEISSCERKRKGWTAATVVGGVGVVGTGVAALVQNSKIQDKKSELKQIKSSVKETNDSIREAEKRLNNM